VDRRQLRDEARCMSNLLADIATGNTDLADVSFLVAFVLGVIAGIGALVRSDLTRLATALLAFAVALVAFGFLML